MVRDPRTLIFILSCRSCSCYCWAMPTTPILKNVPTVIFDQSNSQASRALLDAFKVTGYFSFDYIASTDAEVTT